MPRMIPPVLLQTIMISTLVEGAVGLSRIGVSCGNHQQKNHREHLLWTRNAPIWYKFWVYVIFALYFIYSLQYSYFLISGQRQRNRDKVTPFRNALLATGKVYFAFEAYIRYPCVACITACVLGIIKCLLFFFFFFFFGGGGDFLIESKMQNSTLWFQLLHHGAHILAESR